MIKRLLKLAALGVAFVLIAGASAYFTVSFFIKAEDRVVVPDLTGKDVVWTLERLTRLGLNTKVKGSRYSDRVPANRVLFQDPAPGTEIKKGRDVRIVLSKGPRMLQAPDLKGLPLRQARILLEQKGLCLGKLSKAYHVETSPETILAQFPEKGTPMPQGRCMDLLVSLGPRPRVLKMPDLKGLLSSEAVLLLRRMSLIPGRIRLSEDPRLPEGAILEQDPPAGYPVLERHVVKWVQNRKGPLGKKTPASDLKGGVLFQYRLKDGFLKSHMRLKFKGYGLSDDLIDTYMSPGEVVMLLIPGDAPVSLWLYEDDALVLSRTFHP